MAHHGPDDPPLPLGAVAYLAAFDRYLMATKSGIGSEQREAREEMRDQLDVMIAHSGANVDLGTKRGHRGGYRRFTSEAKLRAAYVAGEISVEEFERRLEYWLEREAA